MKYCANCKIEYEDNINYCSNCGMSLYKKLNDDEVLENIRNRYYKTSLILTISYLIVFVALFLVFKIIGEIGAGLSNSIYHFDLKELIKNFAMSSFFVIILSIAALITSIKSKKKVLIIFNIIFILLTFITFIFG